MTDIDAELERRLRAIEEGEPPGTVQDDLPLVDVVVLCAVLVVVALVLLMWAAR